jgi:putative membrane protein
MSKKKQSHSKAKQAEASQISNKKVASLLGLLSIFYLVGILGMTNSDYKDLLVPLSGWILLLTYIVVYLGRNRKKDQFFYFSFLIFFVGILVEVMGTRTGLLFGTYSYGTNLGIKIFGVPLIIGVNWATLVVCSSAIANHLNQKIWVKALVAAGLMTALDGVIEPVATQLEFWTWAGGDIPFYNYVCWFVLSYPMHYFYMKWGLAEKNKVAVGVYIVLFLFFVGLNF